MPNGLNFRTGVQRLTESIILHKLIGSDRHLQINSVATLPLPYLKHVSFSYTLVKSYLFPNILMLYWVGAYKIIIYCMNRTDFHDYLITKTTLTVQIQYSEDDMSRTASLKGEGFETIRLII